MSEPTIVIPAVPHKFHKIVGGVLVSVLFLLGLAAFIYLEQARLNGFWMFWLVFTGVFAVLVMSIKRSKIYPASGTIVQKRYWLGLVPLWGRQLDIAEFSYVKRHVARATQYATSNKDFFSPAIYLVNKYQREIKLLEFKHCRDNNHAASKEWAEKIAAMTGLTVIDVVENWA